MKRIRKLEDKNEKKEGERRKTSKRKGRIEEKIRAIKNRLEKRKEEKT